MFLDLPISPIVSADPNVPIKSMPEDTLPQGNYTLWSKSALLPVGGISIQEIKISYVRKDTGNLYLRFAVSIIPESGAVVQSLGTYATYAGGGNDSAIESISIPSVIFTSLAPTPNARIGVSIERGGDQVEDTYAADFQIVGGIVQLSSTTVATTAYCTQQDLENRIGVSQLAQLTNDTAGSTTVDANVVAAMIERSDRLIDAKAGQVYSVPFDPTVDTGNCDSIPTAINQISIDYTLYFCFLRRFGNAGVSKDWIDAKAKADTMLDDISNELIALDGNPTVKSKEANMVTQTSTPLIDFYDSNSTLYNF